jgi:hypothetical protein
MDAEYTMITPKASNADVEPSNHRSHTCKLRPAVRNVFGIIASIMPATSERSDEIRTPYFRRHVAIRRSQPTFLSGAS